MSAVRNCIVHTGGKIDDTYRGKLAKYGYETTGSKPEYTVNIDFEQILNSCRSITYVSTQIIMGLVENHVSESNEQRSALDNLLQIIIDQQWRFLGQGKIDLASTLLSSVQFPKDIRCAQRFDIAAWTVMAYMGKESAMREEVRLKSWPNGPTWQLHRSVLLGDRDGADRAITAGMEANEFGRVNLWHDPQFILLRQQMNDLVPPIRSRD
jgi:hypothetical protein